MKNKLSLKTESVRVLVSEELEATAGGRHHHHRLPSWLQQTTTFGPRIRPTGPWVEGTTFGPPTGPALGTTATR